MKPLAVVFVAGNTLAEGKEARAVIDDGVREALDAELIEAGFEIVVIAAGRKIAEAVIDPAGHAEKKYSQLDEKQRQELVSAVSDSILNQKRFREIGDKATGLLMSGEAPWTPGTQRVKW